MKNKDKLKLFRNNLKEWDEVGFMWWRGSVDKCEVKMISWLLFKDVDIKIIHDNSSYIEMTKTSIKNIYPLDY